MSHETFYEGSEPSESFEPEAEQEALFGLETLKNDLGEISDVIPETAEAFENEGAGIRNFMDLVGSIVAKGGKAWRKFEQGLRDDFVAQDNWLRLALKEWPSVKRGQTEHITASEQIARGALLDDLAEICREQVQVEMGEKEKPIRPVPEKPVYAEPRLETATSRDEERYKELEEQIEDNRIRATGDPKGHIEAGSKKQAFLIALLFTLVMGIGEALSGFDVSRAVGTRAGAFGMSLLITAGFNLLSVVAATNLILVLMFLGAQINFRRHFPGGKHRKTGKPVTSIPEPPNMVIWLVGILGTVFLGYCIYRLIQLRQEVISGSEYLQGNEMAVWVVSAAIVIVFFAEMAFSQHYADQFVQREKQLTKELKALEQTVEAEEKARKIRNDQARRQAIAAHQQHEAEYLAALELLEQPEPDPIELAKEKYFSTVQAKLQPLVGQRDQIETAIADRSTRMAEYRGALLTVAIPACQDLIRQLASAVNISLEVLKDPKVAGPIEEMLLREMRLAFENPVLDQMTAAFDPAIPPADVLTSFGSYVAQFRQEEKERIIIQRREEQEHQRKQRRLDAQARLEKPSFLDAKGREA